MRRRRVLHVGYGHADLELDARRLRRVHDLYRPVASQEAGHLVQGPHGGREPDALGVDLGQRRQPLEGQGQVNAALRRCQGVDLVYNNCNYGTSAQGGALAGRGEGGSVGSPRWAKIRTRTWACVIRAIIRRRRWQTGQRRASTPNTRRRSSAHEYLAEQAEAEKPPAPGPVRGLLGTT